MVKEALLKKLQADGSISAAKGMLKNFKHEDTRLTADKLELAIVYSLLGGTSAFVIAGGVAYLVSQQLLISFIIGLMVGAGFGFLCFDRALHLAQQGYELIQIDWQESQIVTHTEQKAEAELNTAPWWLADFKKQTHIDNGIIKAMAVALVVDGVNFSRPALTKAIKGLSQGNFEATKKHFLGYGFVQPKGDHPNSGYRLTKKGIVELREYLDLPHPQIMAEIDNYE